MYLRLPVNRRPISLNCIESILSSLNLLSSSFQGKQSPFTEDNIIAILVLTR